MAIVDDVRTDLSSLLGDRFIDARATGFDETASVIYADDTRPPALVARTRDEAEVAAVVRTAGRTGIPFAVRGRGHSFARHGSVADGLVLDLRLMNSVTVRVESRVGVASAASTTGDYTTAAAAAGLATGFGDNPDVGVPGLTLGGGLGFLSRRDGLTIDNVLSADLVLADGSTTHAAADVNPDLFWALRGGGGNFGIVTSLRLRLQSTPIVTGGVLVFEPDPATVTALFRAAVAAPETVSMMINTMKAPPWPFLPVDRTGTPIVSAVICHSGRVDDADAALAPLRAAGRLIADEVRAQPYPGLFALASEQRGTRTIRRTGFVDEYGEAQAAEALDLVEHAPTSVAIVSLRPMGGAIARVPVDATAFAHRDRAALIAVRAVDRDPVRAVDGIAWAQDVARRVGVAGAANVNFLGGIDGHGSVADAYPPATLERLQRVKAAFDPGNLFRSNYNVTPAARR